MSPGTMRAVTVEEFGPPQDLRPTPRPVPEPGVLRATDLDRRAPARTVLSAAP